MTMQQNAFIACYTDRTGRVVKKGDEQLLRKGGKTLAKVGVLHVQPPSTNANLVILSDVDHIAIDCTANEMIAQEAVFPPGEQGNLKELVFDTNDGTQPQIDRGSRPDLVGAGFVFSMPVDYSDSQLGADADNKMVAIRNGNDLDLTTPYEFTF